MITLKVLCNSLLKTRGSVKFIVIQFSIFSSNRFLLINSLQTLFRINPIYDPKQWVVKFYNALSLWTIIMLRGIKITLNANAARQGWGQKATIAMFFWGFDDRNSAQFIQFSLNILMMVFNCLHFTQRFCYFYKILL